MLTAPRKWYYDARRVRTGDPELSLSPIDDVDGVIFEDSSEDNDAPADQKETPTTMETVGQTKSLSHGVETRGDASAELRRHELFALSACFVGPMLSAYLLHVIRAQLSRPSEGLVSDYNLTIFLLMAELRPCAHLMKMLQARTLYLQKVVQAAEQSEITPSGPEVQDLVKRLDEVEASLTSTLLNASTSAEGRAPPSEEVAQSIRQSFQPQLDALNRAVRRYEKRATTQTMVTEARLQDLELRLQDALSLAAVAAQGIHKPGPFGVLLESLGQLIALPLQAFKVALLFPLQVITSSFMRLRMWLFGTRRRKRRTGMRSEHLTTGGPRVQPRPSKR